MRKLLLLALVIFIMICGSALAGGVINPYYEEAQLPMYSLYSRAARQIKVGFLTGSQYRFDSVGSAGTWTGAAYYADDDGHVLWCTTLDNTAIYSKITDTADEVVKIESAHENVVVLNEATDIDKCKWYEVLYGEYTGYIQADLLAEGSEADENGNKYYNTLYENVPIYSEITTESDAVLQIPDAESDVALLNQIRDINNQLWYEVSYDGVSGYIRSNLLRRAGNFEFRFYVTAFDENGDLITHGFQPYGMSNKFSYEFVVPGDYRIYVYARDKDVEDGVTPLESYVFYNVSVTDSDAVTVAEKVDQLARQCRAAGCKTDYEKALWMHDWLTKNACYDSNYFYYSPDGVLIRGTGVCDSYSRAYEKLLNAVGVECEFFGSYAMNHSWNLVKLDGSWYWVDVTWDDPVVSGITSAASSYENHMYFGLPDALLSFDHVYPNPEICNSYENNYFIKSGKVSMWTDDLAVAIQNELDDGLREFTITPPASYVTERGSTSSEEHGIVYGLAAKALEWYARLWQSDGEMLSLSVSYDVEEKNMPVIASQFDALKNILVLPAALESIGKDAFDNCISVNGVQLPDADISIGESAFDADKYIYRIIDGEIEYITQ